jgi:hypothetical protein
MFNATRLADAKPEQMKEMMDAILSKNPDLFERAQLHEHTSHVRNEDDLYDVLRVHTLRPKNRLQIGCSELYWQYQPFAFDFMMRIARRIGNGYMRYLGFSKKSYDTHDGLYNVWSHVVPDTKPILFFPGLGLGASPYAKYAMKFARTIHMVEVPNIGYATLYSDRQATSKTLYDVVEKTVDTYDVFAHSIGSVHAAMVLNEHAKLQIENTSNQNVIICDGFVNPIDILRSHMYPFVDHCDYHDMKKKTRTRIEFSLFLWIAAHNLEFGSWAKRYHNWYDNTLWRVYPNTTIKYVYSGNDLLYDTDYIAKNCPSSWVVERGSHGSVIFGRQRDDVFKVVKKWLSQIE